MTSTDLDGLFERPAPIVPVPGSESVSLPASDAPDPVDGPLALDCIGLGVWIAYTDSAGAESRRRIIVRQALETDAGLVLEARCLERGGPRRFRVSQITAMRLLPDGPAVAEPAVWWRWLLSDDDTATALRSAHPGLVLMIAVAAADGVILPAELDVMMQYVERFASMDADLDRARMSAHLASMVHDPVLARRAAAVVRAGPSVLRERVAHHVGWIAIADGELVAEEIGVLARLGLGV